MILCSKNVKDFINALDISGGSSWVLFRIPHHPRKYSLVRKNSIIIPMARIPIFVSAIGVIIADFFTISVVVLVDTIFCT